MQSSSVCEIAGGCLLALAAYTLVQTSYNLLYGHTAETGGPDWRYYGGWADSVAALVLVPFLMKRVWIAAWKHLL